MKRLMIFIMAISMLILTSCDNFNSSIELDNGTLNEVTGELYGFKWTLFQEYEQRQAENSTDETVSSDNPDVDAGGEQTPSEPVQQQVSVTIPEGYTFIQIGKTLESKGICSLNDFYQAAQSYTVQSFTIPSSDSRCYNLEGYLFPDTYQFYTNDDPVSVIRKMLNNYAAKSGMPSDNTLIIASIIEKEVRSDEHFKLVSSVYHNRLNAGMKLESDPTRVYVNDFITPYAGGLLGDTSKYAGLYNTYKCAALPAGPICNPGSRAIAAAQSPEASNYLYFFFGNDNQNHYSSTFEEHQAQIDQYGVQYE